MKFRELYQHINHDTDVHVVRGCCIVKKIKRGTYWEDVDYNIQHSVVRGITAIDYRTIEVTIGGNDE